MRRMARPPQRRHRRTSRSFARADRKARFASLAFALALLALTPLIVSSSSAAPAGIQAVAQSSGPGLHATITRTSHGIPHIVADDWADAGFGYGYAFAQDNICVLADIYVTVNGERSKYFGPDGTWYQGGNGTNPNNLNSDFFFQRIKDRHIIEGLLAEAPPRGPLPEVKEGVHGFVEGYNKYLRETGVDNLPDASCRGKPWVREISDMDAYRRFYQLGLLGSQGVVIDGIGGATITPDAQPPTNNAIIQQLGEKFPLGGIGSNAVALGDAATDNARGKMLGNPHFPWDGSERFYDAQITIPSKGVDVAGGSLFGVPVINIGHTDHLAWSHTVSTAYRFTPFEEKLVPGDPHSYFYDGQPRQMRADEVTVTVKNPNGSLSPQKKTLYSTHHGSIFTDLLGVPFPWTNAEAFSIGDANAGNFRYLNHFFKVNQAQSVAELEDILKTYQGIPWVNTIASDSTGDAFYADISVTPHVTDEEAHACNTELGRATFGALGLPVLDGSLSTCEWASPAFGGPDPDAVDPSTFGPSHMPSLHRHDYVTNSNDSYWLSNPNEPLEGYDRIIGDERTERSLRTRSGLVMVERQLERGTFTLQDLQDLDWADEQYAGQLWADQLADFCDAAPNGMMEGSNGQVDVSEACPVIRNWDKHDNLDSRGAILFRRFESRLLNPCVPGPPPPLNCPTLGLVTPPNIWVNQFDANDPVHTPNGLNVTDSEVERSFADAVTDLRSSSIPLDAPLRDWQYEKRGDERIPIHGGPGGLSLFNAINVSWDPCSPGEQECGYPNVPHGSSFIMAAQFTDDPDCPVDTRTIVTYSQSTNPASPWYADQTRMFSNKQWVDERFCPDEIAGDTISTTEIDQPVGYPRPKGATPILASLVPAFDACSAPNSTHGAPLAAPSCSPPQPASDRLTVGTPDRNGKQANAIGTVRYDVASGDPSTAADEADVAIRVSLTDVRLASDLSDYTGELGGAMNLRMTDRRNGAAADSIGTVTDLSFPFAVPCAATASSVGATCALSTNADALLPGTVQEGARSIWELGQVELSDGGPDALAATTDGDKAFAREGIFVP